LLGFHTGVQKGLDPDNQCYVSRMVMLDSADGQSGARLDVSVVGEINPDLILYGVPEDLKPEREFLVQGFRLTLGSSSAIFAHNLSVLGTRVGMASKIGRDEFGKLAVDWLSSGGVDVTRIRQAGMGSATGLTVILTHPGQRFILTYPGTIFELAYEDLDLDYVFSARHLHLSSYFLQKSLRPRIADLFCGARKKGLSTSLDTNDDPDNVWADDVRETLRHVDIFFPNEREAKAIARTDDLARAIGTLSERVRIVAVKLGSEGAIARQGAAEFRASPVRVNAVDAVGAGDSFDAGFIHRFLEGATVEECLNYANVAAAYSTTREGGTEAYRDRNGLANFFREHGAT
jgi:sugar/nucleoside kinase (ribokinase family)